MSYVFLRQKHKNPLCLFVGRSPPNSVTIRQRHGSELEQARVYWPGSGLRTKREIEEEFKCARDGKYPEESADNWTLTGKRTLTPKALFHYTDRRAGKGYSDFATPLYYQRPYIWPPIREINRWHFVICLVFGIFLVFDCEWFFTSFRLFRSAESEAAVLEGETSEFEGREKLSTPMNASEGGGGVGATDRCSIGQSPHKKKRKDGFREQRVIQYENRIRAYSSPDKIFRYFATIKLFYEDGSFDIFMTPEDFVRSLTPGVLQPRKYGLDKYKVYNATEFKEHLPPGDSVFNVFNWMSDSGGLINFGDYLFLMTLLSTSPSEFKLAFHVFDQNGDGVLDQQEFARVQELVLSQSNIGQRHRDHKTGAGAFVKTKNSMLSKHFFGENGQKKLDIGTFLQFQQSFHRNILQIEFERRDPETGPEGIISELSFAELLMIHSDLPEKRQKRMLKRVRRKYGKDLPHKRGVSFEEVDSFFAFIYHIDKVDLALHFYKLAGKPLSKQLLQRVSRKVTGVDLSETVVDVVVTLFDENGDGELSQGEFVAIMKKRMQRGLERPKDTGLFRLIDACWQCTTQFARERLNWVRR